MAGTVADILYDAEDEAIFLSRKWYISDTGYAVWRGILDGEKQTIRLHRLITDARPKEIVDHKNRNKLDNRRKNLRICSQSDNARNRTSLGYFWNTERQKWQAQHNGRFYGRYATKLEAIGAVQKARSGIPKAVTLHPRRKYLPRGVLFMQPRAQKGCSPYYIRPVIKGKRIYKGYFSSVQEAKDAYTNLIQGGLTS